MNDSDFKTGWKHENTGGKWGGKRRGGESMDQEKQGDYGMGKHYPVTKLSNIEK